MVGVAVVTIHEGPDGLPKLYTFSAESSHVGHLLVGFFDFVHGLLGRLVRSCRDNHRASLLCPSAISVEDIRLT